MQCADESFFSCIEICAIQLNKYYCIIIIIIIIIFVFLPHNNTKRFTNNIG